MSKLVSIVIPVYNEQDNLPELFTRVEAVANEQTSFEFEFLIVDNCSTDRTEDIVTAQCAKDPRWKYVRFSRNFGAEVSLAAGLKYARGDAAILLFSDLQEPPEYIPDFLVKWQEGYDVVYGTLLTREDASLFKKLGALVAYKLIEKLSDIKIPANATDYRLMSRNVINAINDCGESNRYLRGLVHWVGFSQAAVPYDRAPRKHGETSTNALFLVGYAVNALIAFSERPLKMASLFGFLMVLVSIGGAVLYTILLILSQMGIAPTAPPPPGWTTLTLLVLFFGGMQSLFMGVIGEYIANIYGEVKLRPLWIVDKEIGVSRPGDDRD
jgi:glycosyltransferase involved in cell wall biosynthesis